MFNFYKNPMHKWLFIPRKWHNSQKLDLQKISKPPWLRNAWASHIVHNDLRLGDLKKYKLYNSTELPHLLQYLEQSLVFWSRIFDQLRWRGEKTNGQIWIAEQNICMFPLSNYYLFNKQIYIATHLTQVHSM